MNEREVSELALRVITIRDKRVKYSKLKELYCAQVPTSADDVASLFELGMWYGLDDTTIRKNLDKIHEDITEDVWQLLYWLEHTV